MHMLQNIVKRTAIIVKLRAKTQKMYAIFYTVSVKICTHVSCLLFRRAVAGQAARDPVVTPAEGTAWQEARAAMTSLSTR